VNSELKRAATEIARNPMFGEVVSFLTDQAAGDVLREADEAARNEKWRDYRALKRVLESIAKWADKAD
jgi:hypothetical protein